MKKSVLLLCALICAIAYAGNGDDKTKERLSTGKKVNSAIDNPSSYNVKSKNRTDSIGDLKPDVHKNISLYDLFAKYLKK